MEVQSASNIRYCQQLEHIDFADILEHFEYLDIFVTYKFAADCRYVWEIHYNEDISPLSISNISNGCVGMGIDRGVGTYMQANYTYPEAVSD
jgi:hypothetical protein